MTKQEYMAISQDTELMCELSYFEIGKNPTTKIKCVSGFESNKTDICTYMIKFGFGNDIEFRAENSFKPILRPYADITSEITHNGKKISPYIELLQESSFNVEKMSKEELDYFKSSWSIPELLSINDAILLIYYHFDICGLIEKGEAIDINTLTDFSY